MDFYSTCCTLGLLLLISVTQAQDEESLIAELQLADMELQDDCENIAHVLKSSLISNNYSELINVQREHAQVLKDIQHTLKKYDFLPFQIERNWTTFVKSGDSLLAKEDLNTLISYFIGNEEYMRTTEVQCDKKGLNCPLIKKVYEEILQTQRNHTLLKKSWSSWQNLLSLRKKDFPRVLNLAKKAAVENEHSDVKSYWEMLVDLENAYEKADALWEEIQPLYLKLHTFVKTRIFKFYNIEDETEEIPVYLLGSNFGHDWSHVADIVLPHPQIYYNAKTYLNKKSVEDVYKLAGNLTKKLSLGNFGEKFWEESNFNMPLCETHVISFCSEEYSAILTCNKTSWVSYLDASEAALDIAVRKTNYLTYPRSRLRFSPIDDALRSLGSTLAITNMRFNGILNKNLFTLEDDNNKMTELLLIALRVLPQLPFYLSADRWRLELLENGGQDIDGSWWKHRKELQRVKGVFHNESDYLGESYLISNRPYLSKFFGIILQFQLLQQYKLEMTDPQEDMVKHIGQDKAFLSLIRERLATDWSEAIDKHFYISELFATSLLEYFRPLENYLDTAPLEQQPFSTEPPIVVEKNPIKKAEGRKLESGKNESKIVERENPVLKETVKKASNEDKDKMIMYFGIGIFVAVMGMVIVSKVVSKRRQNNRNRRFET